MRERERERERECSLYIPHLERNRYLSKVARDLDRDSFFAFCASSLFDTFFISSRPFAISTDETPSSNKNLFIDSLRSRGDSLWMYVDNHHASTFLSLGHHSLCGDCCIKANRCVAFGIRLRSHTEVCSLQTSPSAPCASSFLQSLDNLACKIVRLLTFATVSCDTTPIYNRSTKLHASSHHNVQLSGEKGSMTMLMRHQGCGVLKPSEILYMLVYEKQDGLRRSYRTEIGSCDRSTLLLCNI